MGRTAMRGMRLSILIGLIGYSSVCMGMPAHAAMTTTAGSYVCGVVSRDGYTLTYPTQWRCVNLSVPGASSASGRITSYVLGVAPDRSVIFGAFVIDKSERDQAIVDTEQGVLDGFESDITPPRRTTGWLGGRHFINTSEVGVRRGTGVHTTSYGMVIATTAHDRTYFFFGQADAGNQTRLRGEGLMLQHFLGSIHIA